MIWLRDDMVGLVRTARFRTGYSISKLWRVQEKYCDFNDYKYYIEKHGTLVAQLVGNGFVFCQALCMK